MKRLELIRSHLNFNKTRTNQDDIFGHLTTGPLDNIYAIMQNYKNDTSALKVNLGVGVYKNEEEKSVVFDIVKVVEKELLDELNSGKVNKE